VLEALAATGSPPAEVLLDSTHVKVHRYATGGKGDSGSRRSASAAVGVPPRFTPSVLAAAVRWLPVDPWPGGGLLCRRGSGAEPPTSTGSQQTSLPPSNSPQPSATGCEARGPSRSSAEVQPPQVVIRPALISLATPETYSVHKLLLPSSPRR
jgi:hypothetical protein